MNTRKKLQLSLSLIILLLITYVIYTYSNVLKQQYLTYYSAYNTHMNTDSPIENFENILLGSKSGFGFQQMKTDKPLFLNFYPIELGSDFRLNGLLRKLKMSSGMQINDYTSTRPYGPSNLQGTVGQQPYTNNKRVGPSRISIIIIPDIGASKIYAKWSRNGSEFVKKLDAYGNFESMEKWKCKDVQDTWTRLWFPKDKSGLVEYCWSSVAKIDTLNGYPSNQLGVTTTVNAMGMLDFEEGYETLMKSLNDIGYVNGYTLFGANYDFRKITTDNNMYITSLYNLINSLNGKCIIIGHGFGACVANNFLNSMGQSWKDSKINSFISIAGSYGGVPKALKVLMSGDSLENKKESKLVRNTTLNFDGLHLMLPNPNVYGNNKIVLQNNNTFNVPDIQYLVNNTGSSIKMDVPNNYTKYRDTMVMPPNVLTYVLAGTGLYTESDYVYADLMDDPLKINKNYKGDGTVPDLSAQVPLKWTQKYPVYSRFYDNAEHFQILSMYEPISDLLKVIGDFNGLKF